MNGLYLACLLASWAGVTVLDVRWRLALGVPARRSRRTAALVVGAGVVLFLAWDLVAIAAGYYGRGAPDLMVRIELLPHLPLEEVVFVTFLCHLTLVVDALVRRVRAPREHPTTSATTRRPPTTTTRAAVEA
ncbi:lycopene cyclase domain-containing protein [Cellulomonas composti]|uniref:Lycopene cyclase domain-containing protein n=1 Tax=Cellulomonas composti TaxID=266130 RepID=A0A511J6U6_9CELL|nr:lycopene cyclase domain-containing protein [Cellulomonas composti]GEL93720.1 hypothetical protein CCO02nite_03780 [Cellulomonas composti]